ncbi:T9SS type A sorting domain-containing protein [Flavobacterium antarcticum]|uniref:T9SS type A sorting domain-containing protein n=1 Tax=Flavobacterium antarcticum TaxID=271155 RepID=UPI0003B5A1B0|nr:T9SS type A sorting domain-containing protein [Flavobacterium antarcticum]
MLNIVTGQNLIINGDFELGTIPTDRSQLNRATGWTDDCSYYPTNRADLMDRASSNSLVGVPVNWFGNLDERNGNNRYVYFGSGQGGAMGQDIAPEIIKGSLCSPLISGQYDLSFWVALTQKIQFIPINVDKQILQVYLVNNNDCDGKLVYTSPNNTLKTWNQLTTSFTITPAESNLYNKILIKFKPFTNQNTQGILVDGFDLRKLCDTIDFNLPSIIYSCSKMEELCAPSPVMCDSYQYNWGSTTSNLSLSTAKCFTPSQPGNYSLIITNSAGCTFTHLFTVTDQIPTVNLGPDIIICEGEYTAIPSITISNQGFDNSNFIITWYHNGNVVQNGGTVLLMNPISGVISVEVSLPGCKPQSDQISIITKKCCPTEVNIGMILCKGEEPIFHVLDQGFDQQGTVITWFLDGQVIQNGGEILNTTVYGNGKLTVNVTKPGCPEVSDSILISCKDDGKQTACFKFNDVHSLARASSFYGPMQINEFCLRSKIVIDGSCSMNESGYHLRIAEFNLVNWTFVQDLYNNWVSASGTVPSSVTLNNLVNSMNFVPGKIYFVAISTGPVWTSSPPQFFRVIDCKKPDFVSSTVSEMSLLKMYPNPTSDTVNFVFDKEHNGKIDIYSLEGKLIQSEKFINSNQSAANLSAIPAGTYVAKIAIGDEIITKKIIKK